MEVLHHALRHVHIGSRHQPAVDLECRRAGRKRGSHEQATEELARDLALDPHSPAAPGAALDGDRRTAFVLAAGVDAELIEGIEQVRDGPLAHARDAVETITALTEAYQRGQ